MPSTDMRALIARLEAAPSIPREWPFPDAPVVIPARLWRSLLDDVHAAAALLRSPAERGEGERDEEELSRLYRILGMGGFAGEAPEELFLVGDTDLGCDAWLDPVRYVVGQPVLQHMTNPVRYIRADLASPPALEEITNEH